MSYLPKKLRSNIEFIYPDKAEAVMQAVEEIIAPYKANNEKKKEKSWYKQVNQYAVYPDSFEEKGKTPLQALSNKLDHIHKLGCNTVHILPFLDSPMVDKGFDIKDFYNVRPDLGSTDDILELKNQAEKRGMRIFMDLVFNHVSDEHEWFQKAESGDSFYRDFFIWSKDEPSFIRTFISEGAIWAEYAVNGKSENVFIMFPEQIGSIPHWRQGKDGYWYYHTFYPQQLDTNWLNYHVFLEYVRILGFWVSKGFNFRLDAILFVGKGPYKQTDEYDEKTHTIIRILHEIAQLINPECVFVVETFEDLPRIVQYFGTRDAHQTELAYNFHLCTHLWATLATENSTYVWDKQMQVLAIPEHADWMNFLRNHDELSYAYMSDYARNIVNQSLLPDGEPFRGEFGISGRTFSFLHENVAKYIMAYFLLLSLPGSVALPYGDEYGVINLPLKSLPKQDRSDTRNINRGKLTSDRISTPTAKRILPEMQKIFNARTVFETFEDTRPEKIYEIDSNKRIFSAIYRTKTQSLIVLINLSNAVQTIRLDQLSGLALHTSIGKVAFNKKEVHLASYSGGWFTA